MRDKIIRPERAEAVARFAQLRHDRSGEVIHGLLTIAIDEIRAENDTADKEQVRFNQGRIAAYKELLRYLIVDLPSSA